MGDRRSRAIIDDVALAVDKEGATIDDLALSILGVLVSRVAAVTSLAVGRASWQAGLMAND